MRLYAFDIKLQAIDTNVHGNVFCQQRPCTHLDKPFTSSHCLLFFSRTKTLRSLLKAVAGGGASPAHQGFSEAVTEQYCHLWILCWHGHAEALHLYVWHDWLCIDLDRPLTVLTLALWLYKALNLISVSHIPLQKTFLMYPTWHSIDINIQT